MGVYNPSMKMPQSCWDCFMNDICSKRAVSFSNEQASRPLCCPLVEVKSPHGDLIDRDELIKKARVIHSYDGDGFEFECMGVLDGALDDAPTALEAEG